MEERGENKHRRKEELTNNRTIGEKNGRPKNENKKLETSKGQL